MNKIVITNKQNIRMCDSINIKIIKRLFNHKEI